MAPSGVYAIINVASGRCYVGSTKADYRIRGRQHWCDLRGNRHSNTSLQAAWNQDGERFFHLKFIEHVEDLDLIREREQFYLNRVQDRCYNTMRHTTWCPQERSADIRAKISKKRTGYKRSLQDRAKQSAARKGKPWTENQRLAHAGKPIFPIKPSFAQLSEGIKKRFARETIEERAQRCQRTSQAVIAWHERRGTRRGT